MEFQRLTETNISDQMLTGLKKYAKPLLIVKPPGKTLLEIVKESDDESK